MAYAAKEGMVTLDGRGRNSPYSGALLRYLAEPGLKVEQIFRKVQDRGAGGDRREPGANPLRVVVGLGRLSRPKASLFC